MEMCDHPAVVAKRNAWNAMLHQREMNEIRPKYKMIVALDMEGAFSKDGKIPWHYPEDFKHFQETTTNHVCIMGRRTYDDIMRMRGDKAAEAVLPNRISFVVTSKPLDVDNAIPIANIGDFERYLTLDDIRTKTIFLIGGKRIYEQGMSLASEVITTIVNKTVDGDRFFPYQSLQRLFHPRDVVASSSPDLKFVTWVRK